MKKIIFLPVFLLTLLFTSCTKTVGRFVVLEKKIVSHIRADSRMMKLLSPAGDTLIVDHVLSEVFYKKKIGDSVTVVQEDALFGVEGAFLVTQ